ncbi:MAG: hypothetical protein KJ043_15155 [Anaerolineae bacterium]|nr:hypothetical protein [Anaerolineae bacterium]
MNLQARLIMSSPQKITVLIELSQEMKEISIPLADFLRTRGHVIPLYGNYPSMSYLFQITMQEFAKAVRDGEITEEIVARLESIYREQRGTAPQNTNVYFKQHDIVNLNTVIDYLAKTNVKHLYHGKKVNRKLVLFFAFEYAKIMMAESSDK